MDCNYWRSRLANLKLPVGGEENPRKKREKKEREKANSGTSVWVVRPPYYLTITPDIYRLRSHMFEFFR